MIANLAGGLGANIPTESLNLTTGAEQAFRDYMLEMNVGRLTCNLTGFTSQQTFSHPLIPSIQSR